MEQGSPAQLGKAETEPERGAHTRTPLHFRVGFRKQNCSVLAGPHAAMSRSSDQPRVLDATTHGVPGVLGLSWDQRRDVFARMAWRANVFSE